LHGHAESDIFSSSGAEGDVGLHLALPENRTSEEGQYETSSRFDGGRVLIILVSVLASKVCINKAVQTLIQLREKQYAFGRSLEKVSDDSFYSLAMGFARVVAETSGAVDGVLNIGSGV